MDKRTISRIILIAVVCYGAWGSAGISYGEDLKKPSLEIPQVNIDSSPEELMFEADIEDNEEVIDDSHGTVNIAYGRFRSSLYDLETSARNENFYHSFRLSVNTADGERDNSQFSTYRPSFELGIPFDQENEFVFKMKYFDKIMGLPGKMDALTPSAKRRNSDFQVSGQLTHGLENGTISIEPYYGHSLLNEDIMRRNFKNKMAGMRVDTEVYGNTLDFNIYQNRLIDNYEQTVADARLRLMPLSWGDKWQLLLGANAFAQDDFGQRPAPFVELTFKANDDCSHKLKATRDFSPLVFNQTYLDANYLEVTPLKMRPRRQSLISYEIDRYISTEWRTSVVFYVRQDKDVWYWFDQDNDGLYAPEVIEKVNYGGVKLSTEYTWTESFSHFVSLNVRRIRSKDIDYEFVPFEPKQRLSMGVTGKINSRAKLDIVGDYFGRRFFQGNSKESFSGYFLLGSKYTYELKDYLTLFVLVDNLLNDHYEIVKGYPNQSRSAMAGIRVKF
ncbi:MAG: TonB-dependent receptor [PVC group bacterium]|nr:TonB-dependent receptor [PVC group bacterium]